MSARAACAALAAALGTLLLGCYESHGLGTSFDAGTADAPIRFDAGRPDTGPPPVDAGSRLCRNTGRGHIEGDPPVPRPGILGFSVVNLDGVTHGCPTTFTFLLVHEEVVDPFALPAPRIEIEATVEADLLGEGFTGPAGGIARAIDASGSVVDETGAAMRIEAERVAFGPGGLVEGTASVEFGVPAWSAMGNAEAPYCFASICL